MTTEDTRLASALRDLREQVAALRDHNAYPAVERCLQLVDMNLHLALWQLGHDRVDVHGGGIRHADGHVHQHGSAALTDLAWERQT